jgi:tetratricopeptide (TPR) repeat protein
MFFKTIIQGRLEFGTEKSYSKVVKMFQYRVENYHKNNVIFKEEELFSDDDLTLEIPRYVANVTEKAFKNTVSILKYCSQFAVTGSVRAWMIDNGNIMHFSTIEPESDKGVVQSFLKGRKLVKEEGRQDEAISQLTKSIEKFNRNAMAYERRGKVNFILEKYHDALRDYNKSIAIDDTIPTSYYGKAKCMMLKEEWAEAIVNFDETIKKSIALQPVYWKSRRLKSQCHINLKEYEKAAFDLKLFTNRRFGKDNPNFGWRRWAYYNYGLVLMELELHKEALVALEKASELPEVNDGIEIASLLRLRGQAKKLAGKNGFVKDIKDAAEMGDKQALALLAEM